MIEKYFECIISATACFQVSIILVVLEKFGKYLLQNSKHRQSYKIKYNNKLRENHKFRIIFLVKISSKYSFDCCWNLHDRGALRRDGPFQLKSSYFRVVSDQILLICLVGTNKHSLCIILFNIQTNSPGISDNYTKVRL